MSTLPEHQVTAHGPPFELKISDASDSDDSVSALLGYDGGDEAYSTPEIDVAHLPPVPSDSDSDTMLEAAPGTSANAIDAEESKTMANTVTANTENATAVQSQDLESQEVQVESTLDPNTRPAARLVVVYLSKT
jgi:hypothetical protein